MIPVLTLVLAATQPDVQPGPALLPDTVVAALAAELSGETAKRNLEFIAREHRVRGSRGFHRAAEHIVAELKSYGISDARIEQFPADGKIYYGTQRSRPPWDAEFAELWELRREGSHWVAGTRLASWAAMPVTLAQDSESGAVVANLVDVGDGTRESDYAGKDVRGKLVLAASQPGAVAALAVARFGAAGIVSYAQNQRTAWWGEDENLVRWGHLDTFAGTPAFAFMISLRQARAFRDRLARGEVIVLGAQVKAGKHSGSYEVVTATIPGRDASLRNEEIAFSCHLDHQRPGANDNASGCVTILEIARTISKLIAERRIAPPARTLRFVWPPEIEGTLTLLVARPELASRTRAAIHLDMVGGGPETKATFHVTRGPASLPSFVYDVGAAFGRFVNQQSDQFAGTGSARYPLVAREGEKEPLRAEFVNFTMGSDHEIYTEGSFRIPAIYLNDWPDRYIHTNFDTPANIDPTKLLRAGFIAAASGLTLANLGPRDAEAVWGVVRSAALRRAAVVLERRAELPPGEAASLTRIHLANQRAAVRALERFGALTDQVTREAERFFAELERMMPVQAATTTSGDTRIYERTALKGPMSVFGYDYLEDKLGAERARALGLLRYNGRNGSGSEYAYEVLNLVDGVRTVQQIRDVVAAAYGPIPPELVAEYLEALAAVGAVRFRP